MTDTEKCAAAIKDWDGRDIAELRDMLRDLDRAVDDETSLGKAGDYVDMAALPFSDRVPDAVAGYPTWTVDDLGMALVGKGADDIEPLADVVSYCEEADAKRRAR